jgi:hypothetical protein
VRKLYPLGRFFLFPFSFSFPLPSRSLDYNTVKLNK